uniref:hypothetical protein n=1 Tax=Flavisolibacter nicotianae TaxID=2364882 RepID=UPI000EAE4654
WYILDVYPTFVTEQEEPCESRGSRTVLWEHRGETPRCDPTSGYFATHMITDKKGKEFLNILVGEKLSSVTFVMDYLQLDFDGNQFTLYVWPLVSVDGKEYRFGEPSYRDYLCSLIARVVKQTSGEQKNYFTLEFENGSKLSVSLDPNSPELFGEIAHFTDTNGKWYVFD